MLFKIWFTIFEDIQAELQLSPHKVVPSSFELHSLTWLLINSTTSLWLANHKLVVEFINNQVNECSSNEEGTTLWGDNCNSAWISSKIVNHILNNIKLNNPYNIDKPLIQTSQDPRIQAEGKAGQSTDKGIIFVSENNFESEAGSEWVIGTCVKSPCVAAGNNELVSAYR